MVEPVGPRWSSLSRPHPVRRDESHERQAQFQSAALELPLHAGPLGVEFGAVDQDCEQVGDVKGGAGFAEHIVVGATVGLALGEGLAPRPVSMLSAESPGVLGQLFERAYRWRAVAAADKVVPAFAERAHDSMPGKEKAAQDQRGDQRFDHSIDFRSPLAREQAVGAR